MGRVKNAKRNLVAVETNSNVLKLIHFLYTEERVMSQDSLLLSLAYQLKHPYRKNS